MGFDNVQRQENRRGAVASGSPTEIKTPLAKENMGETKLGPICVIGMHRSGTSLVARLLNSGGLYLAYRPTPQGISRQSGRALRTYWFFEDQ